MIYYFFGYVSGCFVTFFLLYFGFQWQESKNEKEGFK